MGVPPGTCPSWAFSLESGNPASVTPTPLGCWHHPEPGHWVLQHWPGQYQGPDQARTRLRAPAPLSPGALNSRTQCWWVGEPRAVRVLRPLLGDAAAPSHFPLGPLLAFQAAAFSIVNLETEKEAGGLGEAAWR